jgi:hypothetical protein
MRSAGCWRVRPSKIMRGAVLSIDDAANQLVYGEGTTPRMIFEGRTRQQPADRIVDFRDALEEATATARARRGTATTRSNSAAAPATVTTSTSTSAGAQTQPLAPPSEDAQPAPFEDVPADSVRSEPLPPDPAPSTTPGRY